MRGSAVYTEKRSWPSWAICACAVLAMLAAPILPAGTALGSTRSQVSYSRGLISYNLGQWDEAHRFFEEAVLADSEDALAVYFRGLAAARLALWGAAAQDVETALRLRGDVPHAALNLGTIYFDMQRYPEAEQWLQIAHQSSADRAEAALFLGLTRYRNGDYAGAEKLLAEAEQDPRFALPARYYRALALLRLGQDEQGRSLLARVRAESPHSEAGRLATAYLDEDQAPTLSASGLRGESAEGRWSLRVESGLEYDSNVVLAPNDSDVRDSRPGYDTRDDGRFRVGAGGAYRFLETDALSIRGGYDFYQSVHFDLSDYDLQTHRVGATIASRPGEYQFGLSGHYEFDAMDFSSYYQQGQAIPWVSFSEGEGAAGQLYYRFRARDFFRQPFEPYRDSLNNALGMRQVFRLGAVDRLLSFGYQWDGDDPLSDNGDDFEYMGHNFDARLEAVFFTSNSIVVSYLFRLEDYENPNSRSMKWIENPDSEDTAHPWITTSGYRRHDKDHELALRYERAFTSHFMASTSVLARLNQSNLDPFAYDRVLLSFGVQYVF